LAAWALRSATRASHSACSASAGLVVLLVVHGDLGLLELVLGRFHFHGGELGTAGTDGGVHRRLGDGILLGGRVAGATGQDQAAAQGQRGQLQPAQVSG
jgi:hypothetical protein